MFDSGLGDRHQQNGVNYTLDLNTGLTQVLADGTNSYLYGNGRIAQSGSTTEYFLGDALGSVRQLVDPAGVVTLTQSYASYGDTTSSVGSGYSAYQYTGEMRDANELTYLRARYLDSGTGRFTQRDPSGLEANLYLYAGANPIMNIDPSGLFYSWYVDFVRTNNNAPEWTVGEMFVVDITLKKIATRYADAYNQGASQLWVKWIGLCPTDNSVDLYPDKISPLEAFWYIHKGPITFERRPSACAGCWAQTQSSELIYFFSNATIEDPRFIAHEMGHAFENALWGTLGLTGSARSSQKLGRNSLTESLWWRSYDEEQYGGFAGGLYQWQWNPDAGPYDNRGTEDYSDDTDGRGEIFADMFVGWVFNRWEVKKGYNEFSRIWTTKGQERANHMSENMPMWIFNMIEARKGKFGEIQWKTIP